MFLCTDPEAYGHTLKKDDAPQEEPDQASMAAGQSAAPAKPEKEKGCPTTSKSRATPPTGQRARPGASGCTRNSCPQDRAEGPRPVRHRPAAHLPQADAANSHRHRSSGLRAWTVADGIGDDWEPAYAAQLAARRAARAATTGGAAYGIAAARAGLQYEYDGAPRGQEGDCVMVTAVPMADHTDAGLDIAWVGDCRAYVVQDRLLRQVTEDHTEGGVEEQGRAARPDAMALSAEQRDQVGRRMRAAVDRLLVGNCSAAVRQPPCRAAKCPRFSGSVLRPRVRRLLLDSGGRP
jgi:hypothetical protein